MLSRIIILSLLLFGLFAPNTAQAQKDPKGSDSTKTIWSYEYLEDTTKFVKPYYYYSDRYGGPFSYRKRSPLVLPLPKNLLDFHINIDSSLQYYNTKETFGPFNYRLPSRINRGSYQKYRYGSMMQNYFRGTVDPADTSSTAEKGVIPPIEMQGKLFKRIFGGDQITLQPNGNIVLDFGGLWQRVDNPSQPARFQRQGGFNFDQQIGMNLQGKIGEKLNVNFNFDTKNTFQFEQAYNIGYTAFEEDIIQEVQLGNVNFPVNNSLIAGAQNLFGVKTRLRFGKLWVNSVISNQRGTVETIRIKNGAQSREFEIRADSYEQNQHFFLSQFFRDNYEIALKGLPNVNSGVQITRVDVYVTNRTNASQDIRNVIAITDLADTLANPNGFYSTQSDLTRLRSSSFERSDNQQFSIGTNAGNLNLTQLVQRGGRSTNALVGNLQALGLVNGTDFFRLDNARKLSETEYTLNQQLGYISLNTPLRNDEVLAVAFEYTFNGETHRVGELREEAATLNDEDAIYLKLIRPNSIQPELITWQLMMRNIYSLNTTRLKNTNFQARVVYRDDNSGLDQPKLQEGVQLQERQLVNIMGADNLNPNRDRQSDGNFDYVAGVTVDELTGRLVFPVLEPFGQTLEKLFLPSEQDLEDKYVFEDLYDRTQADAKLNRTQNKYFIKGQFESGSSKDILLPGINIAPNSVVVRAGGTLLTEGADYNVDYQFGRVQILNQGVLSSAKEIVIQYERADLFSLQTRSLVGVDLEYIQSEKLKFTGTLLHYNERAILTRVAIGNEPVRNTVVGLGVDYRGESRVMTRLANLLPNVSSKEDMPFNFRAEVAANIPGSPRLTGQVAYIDDFEGTEVAYDLTRNPQSWQLGSIPQLIRTRENLGTSNDLEAGYRRAKLSWYNPDVSIFYTDGGTNVPDAIQGIKGEISQNHYTRAISFAEVFPNRQRPQIPAPETSFDLAYYPDERGPYNVNNNSGEFVEVNGEFRMTNPERNFGAITKAITHDVDFDNLNIQYVEFWMMDPFMGGDNATIRDGVGNTSGGEFYLNLGSISEDVVPDGKHFFENGLTVDRTGLDSSPWGYSPTQQYLTNAFGTAPGERGAQDVGFDGLDDTEEAAFYQAGIPAPLYANVYQNDPAGDNFQHYLDADPNGTASPMLQLYKNFNNPDGNSPDDSGTGGAVRAYTNNPENEDLNNDNTLSDIDQYYQYRMNLRPDLMEVGSNFIVDKLETSDPTAGNVTWYQFRIPVRTEEATKVGNIDGFKSIRYIRMFMTGWRQPVVLRMVQFQFVSAQWRPVTEFSVAETGFGPNVEPPRSFDVSTVNIEENGDLSEGTIPYDLPPGFNRDFDQTSTVTRQLNEQSLQVCVDGLEDGDGRAVFKPITMDFINYERLKMEVHANRLPNSNTDDGDLSVFVRLGTDENSNYYEIEWDLTMTPLGQGSYSREAIWPRDNELNIAFDDLIRLKANRNLNKNSLNPIRPDSTVYHLGKYRIRIVGAPDISNIQYGVMGLRNPKTADALEHSACVWFNEMRVTDFRMQGGYAASVQLNTQLADFASINATANYSSVGYGGIQDKIADRNRYSQFAYDLSSQINLHKLLPEEWGLSLPMFVSYERDVITPQFDPLNPDTELDKSAERFTSDEKSRDYIQQVRTITTRRSINLTNVRKNKMNKEAKAHLWDISNFSLSAAYADEFSRDALTESYVRRQWSLGAVYSFAPEAKPWEPFKDKKWRQPYMKFLKDLNFNLTPLNVSVSGQLNRTFMKTQLRNQDFTTEGIEPFFEKQFTFTRDYAAQWNLTKSLALDYRASAYAVIDEPSGEIDDVAQDSILTNLRSLGRMKNFTQSINTSYKLPFDKFPVTKWLGADTRYAADYTWMAGPEGLVTLDSLGEPTDTPLNVGNTIQNVQSVSVNGKIDLTKVYKTIPFLRRINTLKNGKKLNRGDDPLEIKKKRIREKLAIVKDRLAAREAREQRKAEKLAAKLEKAKSSEKDTTSTEESDPKEEEIVVEPEEEVADTSRLEFKKYALEAALKEVEEQIRERRKKGEKMKEPSKAKVKVIGTLMSVQNINISLSRNSTTTLPGFLPIPKFVGMDEGWQAPGASFLLGSQNSSILDDAQRNGWLAATEFQNQPFVQTQQRQLSIKTDLEPFKNFKINLEFSRSRNFSYSEQRRWNETLGQFETQSAVRNGGFTTTVFALPTAFTGQRSDNSSAVFEEFERNLLIIKDRLDPLLDPALIAQGVEFDTTSQDVMIPAFTAAYLGKDASSINLSAVRSKLPFPAWRLSYNGLAKLPAFKEKFKSITITHGYKAEYSTGSYTSSLVYVDASDGIDLSDFDEGVIPYGSYLNDPTAVNALVPVPVLIYNDVSISERFFPLIGLNIRTKKDLSIKIDYNKSREIGLSLSNAQVTELRNNEISLDIGFVKKGLKLPLSGKILENDVTFRCAFSLRDTKTTQHRINDRSIVTQGDLNWQFRPTIAYDINKRTNFTFYFERNVRNPRISSSFKTANTAFGFQLRFNLAQ